MDDPTLDELIAWAEKKRDLAKADAGQANHPREFRWALDAAKHHEALAAALRELRQLREGVARVREFYTWRGTVVNGDLCASGDDWVSLASVLRALTPEGTT